MKGVCTVSVFLASLVVVSGLVPLEIKADLSATLEISQPDFPELYLRSEILLDDIPFDGTDGHHPILGQNNFELREDGALSPISVQGLGHTKIQDVVFVYYSSGEVNDYHWTFIESIGSFFEAYESNTVSCSMGYFPFGGIYPASGDADSAGMLYDTSHDLTAIIGEPAGETFGQSFNAIVLAEDTMSWRSGSGKSIVLITPSEDSLGSYSQDELIALLNDNDITLHVMVWDADSCPTYAAVAEATGGEIFNITDGFPTAFTAIADMKFSDYMFSYTSPNSEPNGIPRTVSLEVNYVTNGVTHSTTVTNTYTPNLPLTIELDSATKALSESANRLKMALPITAYVTGGPSDTNNVSLCYSTNGDDYLAVDMVETSGSYHAEIPAGDVLNPWVKYYISATDGQETTLLPTDDSFQIAVLPNQMPVISHTPVTKAQKDTAIPIEFTVEDVTHYIEEIGLFYRYGEDGSFDHIPLDPTGTCPETVKTNLPGTTTTPVQYYIEAMDNLETVGYSGSASDPHEIYIPAFGEPEKSQTIGNLKVYANSIVTNSTIYTASGNVQLSTLGGDRVLGFGGSVKWDKSGTTVKSSGNNTLTALGIERTSGKTPEDFPLFNGGFEVDATPEDLAVELTAQVESKFSLIDGISFPLPEDLVNIALHANDVTIDQAILDLLPSTLDLVNIELALDPIVLSQKGDDSTGTLSIKDSNKYKLKKLELKEIGVEMDFISETFSISSTFEMPPAIPSMDAEFGFIYNPFCLDSLEMKYEFNANVAKKLTIPPLTATTPVGARLTSIGLEVDNISDVIIDGEWKSLEITGIGNFKLVDLSGGLEKLEENVLKKTVIGGDISLFVDLSGNVELSGTVKLLDSFELGEVTIIFGNPTSLDAYVNLLDVVKGNLYLGMGVSGGVVTFVGQTSMALYIPSGVRWVGGKKIGSVSVGTDLRFSSSKVKKAQFSAGCTLGRFFTIYVRVDVADPLNPDCTCRVKRKKIKWFSLDAALQEEDSIYIDSGYDCAIIQIESETNTPSFDLIFPDGRRCTPTSAALDPDNIMLETADTNVLYMTDDDAHQAFYALETPNEGTYKVEIHNKKVLGSYSIDLVFPYQAPEIEITNVAWEDPDTVSIEWLAEYEDGSPLIALYYDDDTNGFNGQIITNGLSVNDSPYSWTLDTSMQSGTYYVFACIDDDLTVPVFAYAASSIDWVNPDAPGTPDNVNVAEGDGCLTVEWDAGTETDLLGYRVLLSETPDDRNYEYTLCPGTNTQYVIENLANWNEYEVAVQAVNTNMLASLKSEGITAMPNGTAEGGAPDLAIDLLNSAMAEFDVGMVIDVCVTNKGRNASYSADLACYSGGLNKSNQVGSVSLGAMLAGESKTATFILPPGTYDTNDLVVARLEDVELPEFERANNQAIIPMPSATEEDLGLFVYSQTNSVDAEGCLLLNRQTGLYEQTITVENNSASAVGGFVLYIDGLADGVKVYNADGYDEASGRYYMLCTEGLSAYGSISFALEYYDSLRREIVAADIQLSIEPVSELSVNSVRGSYQAIGFTPTADGSMLVEFASEPGTTYYVEYSDDLINWNTVESPIRATRTRTEWFDDGPPKTPCCPDNTSSRFYRVLQIY
jgi:hypothetical protein